MKYPFGGRSWQARRLPPQWLFRGCGGGRVRRHLCTRTVAQFVRLVGGPPTLPELFRPGLDRRSGRGPGGGRKRLAGESPQQTISRCAKMEHRKTREFEMKNSRQFAWFTLVAVAALVAASSSPDRSPGPVPVVRQVQLQGGVQLGGVVDRDPPRLRSRRRQRHDPELRRRSQPRKLKSRSRRSTSSGRSPDGTSSPSGGRTSPATPHRRR